MVDVETLTVEQRIEFLEEKIEEILTLIRQPIGIKLDKDYYDAACKRLEEHQRQGRLY